MAPKPIEAHPIEAFVNTPGKSRCRRKVGGRGGPLPGGRTLLGVVVLVTLVEATSAAVIPNYLASVQVKNEEAIKELGGDLVTFTTLGRSRRSRPRFIDWVCCSDSENWYYRLAE